jgi:hypothetical protein
MDNQPKVDNKCTSHPKFAYDKKYWSKNLKWTFQNL